MGVRRRAVISSGAFCPYYEYSGRGSAEHERFLEQVNRALHLHGFTCSKDVPVIDRGVADLVCRKDAKVLVVEIKSYPLSSATLADLLQLAMYCTEVGSDCMLAYRGLYRGDGRAVFVHFKRDAAERVVGEAGGAAGGPGVLKKPGPECFWCAHKDSCEFSATKLSARYGIPSANTQPASPSSCLDLRALYQELLKIEWCLMRHGAICTNTVHIGGSAQQLYAYFSPSGFTVHNTDAVLTPLHIEAACYKVAGAVQCSAVLQSLMRCGLLVEKDCSEQISADFKDGVVLILLNGENSTSLQFLKLVDLAMAAELVAVRDRERAEELLRQVVKEGGRCYKTIHGEFVRLLRGAGPLPGWPVTLEAYLLPFIEDIIGSRNINANTLINQIRSSVGNDELQKLQSILGALRSEANQPITSFSQFQLEGMKRLFELERQARSAGRPLFYLLTAPPGSGKTVIFITYALLKALTGEGKVVIMYPTKALAKQQLQLLIYTVEALRRALGKTIKLAIYDGDSRVRPGGDVRGLECSQGKLVYDNKGRILCGGQPIDWLTEVDVQGANVIVTNPFKLSSDLLRQKPWTRQIRLIVVDEAHQFLERDKLDLLTATLHRLFIDMCDGVSACRLPDIIVSSATITSSGFPFARADGMTFRSIGGFVRASPGSQHSRGVDKISELILGGGLAAQYEKGETDYYTVASTGDVKLTLPLVLFTNPAQSPLDTAAEALVSSIIFSRATSRIGGIGGIRAALFIDNLDNQKELYKKVAERLLIVELSMADKLLCRPAVMNIATKLAGTLKLSISQFGHTVVGQALSTGDPALDRYVHLTLYCRDLSSLQSALQHAQLVYRQAGANLVPPQCFQDAKDDTVRVLSSLATTTVSNLLTHSSASQSSLSYQPLLRYNAEMPLPWRAALESFMQSGDWDAVITTSALEAGVNLPKLGVVLQFGLPDIPETTVQRWGRGGRSADTFLTSLGVLIARNSGEDVMLTDEDYAVRRLFGYEPRALQQIRGEDRIKRVLLLVGYQFCRGSNQLCESALRQSEAWLSGRSTNIGSEIRDVIQAVLDICRYANTSNRQPLKVQLNELNQNLQKLINPIGQLLKKGLISGPPAQRLSQFQQYLNSVVGNLGILYSNLPKLYNMIRGISYVIGSLSNPSYGASRPQPHRDQQIVVLIARLINDDLQDLEQSILKTIASFYVPPASGAHADECVRRLLTVVAVPNMPDPYVAVPQAKCYALGGRVATQSDVMSMRSKGVEELYETEAPLWLREHE